MEWLSDIIVGGTVVSFWLLLSVISYLSSKNYDMARYRDRVCYSCAFPNNQLDMAYYFNDVLKKPYLFTEGYGPEFVTYYREYRDWLLCKYFDRNVRFTREFPNYLSWKNRKHYDQKAFEEVYCAVSKEILFLAQTFYLFSKYDFEKRCYRDIPAVECQMRLGSIYMMRLIDPNNNIYKYEIDEAENLFKKAMESEKE